MFADFKNSALGTSLEVQWLRPYASKEGVTGSIPGQGAKIFPITWCSPQPQKSVCKQTKKKPIMLQVMSNDS